MRLMGASLRLCNTYVSNIPGPRVPVYLLEARMLEIYPVAPVVGSLAVAVLNYDTGLHWGFDADWDGFPDLHELPRWPAPRPPRAQPRGRSRSSP